MWIISSVNLHKKQVAVIFRPFNTHRQQPRFQSEWLNGMLRLFGTDGPECNQIGTTIFSSLCETINLQTVVLKLILLNVFMFILLCRCTLHSNFVIARTNTPSCTYLHWSRVFLLILNVFWTVLDAYFFFGFLTMDIAEICHNSNSGSFKVYIYISYNLYHLLGMIIVCQFLNEWTREERKIRLKNSKCNQHLRYEKCK